MIVKVKDAQEARAHLRRGAVVRTSGEDVAWYGAWTVLALPRVRALVASLTADR